MKPPEYARTKIVNEWRRKADADLAVAERLLSDETVFSNAVTFHCQQAARRSRSDTSTTSSAFRSHLGS
jgi:hypothetical protein